MLARISQLFSPSRGVTKRPTRREALNLRPLRNPDLEWYEDEEDGVVVLHLKRERTAKTRWLDLLVQLPAERKITLDVMGSDVWRMCDGKTLLREVTGMLVEKYQLSPREAEISAGQFFNNLGRRGYVILLQDEEKAKSTKSKSAKPKPSVPGAAKKSAATKKSPAEQVQHKRQATVSQKRKNTASSSGKQRKK